MNVDLNILFQGNPGLWFETEAKIRTVKKKLETPRMNILQRRINAYYMACRRKNRAVRAIGLKPRKRGFSTMVSAIAYTELQRNPYEAVVIGNKLETSDTVFRMMRVYNDNDGLAKRGEWSSNARWTGESASWSHGALLSQSTAMNSESIRGQTPNFLHGTEVAHWQNQDEVFLALMNAVPDDPTSCIFLESTPNGSSGAFHQQWTEARWPTADECPEEKLYWKYWEVNCPDQENSFLADFEYVRIFAAWFEFEEASLVLTAEQKEKIKATLDAQSWYKGERDLLATYLNVRESDGKERLGIEVEEADVWEQLAWRRMIIRTKCKSNPDAFDQEYPRDPDSCFLASGNRFFDADAITHYQNVAKTIPRDNGTLVLPEGSERPSWHIEPPDTAIFWRWEQPKHGCYYLISVDTAAGEDQADGKDPDRHSVLVWRKAYMDHTGIFHPHRLVARVAPPCRVPIYALVNYVDLLRRYYGNAMIVPEMNNTGLAFVLLANQKGMNIWRRKEINPQSGKETAGKQGFYTTDNADYGGLRTIILQNLHALTRGESDEDDKVVRLVDIACPNFAFELNKFSTIDGKAQGDGAHDDDVMSAAIGLYCIDSATAMTELPVVRRLPKDLRGLAGGGSEGSLAMRS